jgi:hypothetical protein
MSKKYFLSYVLCLLLLIVFVFIKQRSITKKNQKPSISFYSSWEKEGRPVLVQKVQKNDLETTWKMTISSESDDIYIGYVPKSVQRAISTASPIFIHFQEKKIPATICHIDSLPDINSGMCAVKIKTQEKVGEKNEKHLAEVATSGMKNVVLLPFDTLHMENDHPFVWIIKEGKAHKKLVALGDRNNKGILADGVEEDALIILNGSETLKENDPVKITYGN